MILIIDLMVIVRRWHVVVKPLPTAVTGSKMRCDRTLTPQVRIPHSVARPDKTHRITHRRLKS